MAISRRRFLESATVSVGGVHAAGTQLPTRPFGRTGVRVPILAFGSGSRFLMYKEEDKALAALNKAIDLGITYVDTAAAYGDGASEERVGKVMKTRRKEVFLVSKINERDPEKVKRTIDRTFRLLQTDHLDVLHIHSLLHEDDLAKVESKGGVLDILRKLRDEKSIRFMGITSHTNPEVLAKALERHDFNCTQMALNAALMGMATFTPGASYPAGFKPCFETVALPVANRKGLGVIAMKIFGQEKLVGAAPVETLIRYSLSLPVSTCVLGMPKLEYIEQNVQVARDFKPMPRPEMQRISTEVSGKLKAALDQEFARHIDA
ncbi:MAG: aldo/keto reductase [Bryobacteraceae bacterium]